MNQNILIAYPFPWKVDTRMSRYGVYSRAGDLVAQIPGNGKLGEEIAKLICDTMNELATRGPME